MKPLLKTISNIVRLRTGELAGVAKTDYSSKHYFKIDEQLRQVEWFEGSYYEHFVQCFPEQKHIRNVRDSKAKRDFIRNINENTIRLNVKYVSFVLEQVLIHLDDQVPFSGDWNKKIDKEAVQCASEEVQVMSTIYEMVTAAAEGLSLAYKLDDDLGLFVLNKKPTPPPAQ